MCSKALYEDVKKLAESLDQAAKDSTRTIRVVQIKGVDPVLVQQAIEAVQGNRRNGQGAAPGAGMMGPSTGPGAAPGASTGEGAPQGPGARPGQGGPPGGGPPAW